MITINCQDLLPHDKPSTMKSSMNQDLTQHKTKQKSTHTIKSRSCVQFTAITQSPQQGGQGYSI